LALPIACIYEEELAYQHLLLIIVWIQYFFEDCVLAQLLIEDSLLQG